MRFLTALDLVTKGHRNFVEMYCGDELRAVVWSVEYDLESEDRFQFVAD